MKKSLWCIGDDDALQVMLERWFWLVHWWWSSNYIKEKNLCSGGSDYGGGNLFGNVEAIIACIKTYVFCD